MLPRPLIEICDRCGVVVPDADRPSAATVVLHRRNPITATTKTLCHDCQWLFSDWMSEPRALEEATR